MITTDWIDLLVILALIGLFAGEPDLHDVLIERLSQEKCENALNVEPPQNP